MKSFIIASMVAGTAVAASVAGIGHAQTGAPAKLVAPTYTAVQAARGEAIYTANCAECHGKNLDDGEFAAALKGEQFHQHWGKGGLDGPFDLMSTQMPPTNPGSLPAQSYADALAYIVSRNGVPATPDKELPADAALLKTMAAP